MADTTLKIGDVRAGRVIEASHVVNGFVIWDEAEASTWLVIDGRNLVVARFGSQAAATAHANALPAGSVA